MNNSNAAGIRRSPAVFLVCYSSVYSKPVFVMTSVRAIMLNSFSYINKKYKEHYAYGNL